jgi:hypothetical protein
MEHKKLLIRLRRIIGHQTTKISKVKAVKQKIPRLPHPDPARPHSHPVPCSSQAGVARPPGCHRRRQRRLMLAAHHRSSSSPVPKYFHVWCCAHIINLVVTDGTAIISHLTTNVRKFVKYIKKSVSRLHKFVEICRFLAITIGEGLKLHVTKRWNSTYHMLRTTIAYRDALESCADSVANY